MTYVFRRKVNTEFADWFESAAGNHVCIYDEALVCTVYKSKHTERWQIVINEEDGGYFVQEEGFLNYQKAIARAEKILGGAECNAEKAKPKPYGFT